MSKVAVLSLALWLVGAQGFAALDCCARMPAPEAACDGCGSQSDRETPSPRPDCCTNLEPQKDVEVSSPKVEVPENSVAVDLLTEDTSFTPLWPRSVDLVAEQAAYEAEGPPLYLRNEVFLI